MFRQRFYLPPPVARHPEFQQKMHAALRVVMLTDFAVVLIIMCAALLPNANPQIIPYMFETGDFSKGVMALIALILAGLGVILYIAAIIWATCRKPHTGIPVWKQILPFASRHFTLKHIHDELVAKYPELLQPIQQPTAATFAPPGGQVPADYPPPPPNWSMDQSGAPGQQPSPGFAAAPPPPTYQGPPPPGYAPPPAGVAPPQYGAAGQSQFDAPPGQSLFSAPPTSTV